MFFRQRVLATLAALAAVSVVVLFALTAAAQDAVTVGTAIASGASVDIPVYIRDASGTPLGVDQPSGSKIQSFSIKVDYSPASAVQSVTFSRAGITASLTPTVELKPTSPGSASLLATFQESTNEIPFGLNAASPGNLVAQLSFNLSASAAPGSSITLSLDAGLTQLTDQGGSAATKETYGNGRLALVDGSIKIPALSVSLSPAAIVMPISSTRTMTARASSAVLANTTITLRSSHPEVAGVPASVLIPAGQSTGGFIVSAISTGDSTITATLGSSTASGFVTVNDCQLPDVPVASAPANATVGTTYVVSWAAVDNATGYQIDEASNAPFQGATTRVVTETSASYSHDTPDVHWYYRVRARNNAGTCDEISANSTPISLLITAANCPLPSVPVATAQNEATVGASYTVSWVAVEHTTEYQIDEAPDAQFDAATTRVVTETSASYTHDTPDTRWYYRVRARSNEGACDVSSASSTPVSVLITVGPLSETRILPVAGSLQGDFGSYFKTSLSMYNAKNVTASGTLVFHPAGASSSASAPSISWSIGPFQSLGFADLLPAMGVASGLGSVDVVGDPDSPIPVALARVFNDGGAAGTSGFTEELLAPGEALIAGTSGALIAPSDTALFRLNIGVRSLEGGASMNITVRDISGTVVKEVTRTYGPNQFNQVSSSSLLDGYALTGGESITFAVTSGSALVYGATTDNTTNDPSVQLARRIE